MRPDSPLAPLRLPHHAIALARDVAVRAAPVRGRLRTEPERRDGGQDEALMIQRTSFSTPYETQSLTTNLG